MIYRSLLVLIAAAALLLGVQLPGFVTQYEQRLDAHLSEAGVHLRAYQEIADRFFGGSLAALLAKHEASADPVFRAEAKPLRELFERYQHFSDEKQALTTALPGKLLYLAHRGDRELVNETWRNYAFTVPLDAAALMAGVTVMLVLVLMTELLRIGLRKLFAARQRVPRAAR
jgi:hypothetical protein